MAMILSVTKVIFNSSAHKTAIGIVGLLQVMFLVLYQLAF